MCFVIQRTFLSVSFFQSVETCMLTEKSSIDNGHLQWVLSHMSYFAIFVVVQIPQFLPQLMLRTDSPTTALLLDILR